MLSFLKTKPDEAERWARICLAQAVQQSRYPYGEVVGLRVSSVGEITGLAISGGPWGEPGKLCYYEGTMRRCPAKV